MYPKESSYVPRNEGNKMPIIIRIRGTIMNSTQTICSLTMVAVIPISITMENGTNRGWRKYKQLLI